jgi:hypothetical protein
MDEATLLERSAVKETIQWLNSLKNRHHKDLYINIIQHFPRNELKKVVAQKLLFYPFLLGIWAYREMQLQSSLWLNTWLRFSLLIVLILCLTDITENILLGLLLNGISYPFKTLAIVTRLKWISFAFILLSLLIGVIGRKTGLFPLSLLLKKPN